MSLINFVAAFWMRPRKWDRGQADADLMVLDDRSLADIGTRRPEFLPVLCETQTVDIAAGGRQSTRPRRPEGSGYFPPF